MFLIYLENQWLHRRAQLLLCFVKRYRNFGIWATSGLESAYNELKTYLVDRLTDLNMLFDKVKEMVSNKSNILAAQEASEAYCTWTKYYNNVLLGDLPTKVMFKALKELYKSYLTAEAALYGISHLDNCGGYYARQYGLPCPHIMYAQLYLECGSHRQVVKARERISLRSIDRFWWLPRSLVCDLPLF